ncbi:MULTISPECIES: ParD-like family protein [Marinobacter]|uniref:ParD-like family protein n=1 Tax=Marinobacter suaedae TaxID=3057675 RepID=A0ABT8VVZ9_9GAMM|nr:MULTISPECIES: ParD-like family protein [unclassified Marinobacter]MBZ2168286.1 ParD-like family protein [Marinobacter sp. F4216]MDO3720159.1 ParD-like family protein [Marinobacter sp. chi1]
MSSPIRLDPKLLQDAAAVGKVARRSTPQQIQYWAEIGQMVADSLSQEDLVALSQGLLTVKLERKDVQPPSTDTVLADVAQLSESGALTRQLTASGPVYQASASHPGYLEQVQPNGHVVVGYFENGVFVAKDDAA